MKIDNDVSKNEKPGVTIKENLPNGELHLVYFKVQGEFHFPITDSLELYINMSFYNWFLEDGKLEVIDNGQETSQQLSLLQRVQSLKVGFRYYFE